MLYAVLEAKQMQKSPFSKTKNSETSSETSNNFPATPIPLDPQKSMDYSGSGFLAVGII